MGFQFNPLSGQFDIAGSGAAQVNSDWNATSGVSQILNKPSLFSGAYSALTGIPSTFAPSAHTHPATDVTGLAAVATSGSASDLGAGTLALARLNALVSRDDIDNNFTAGQTITAAANTSALTASYSVTGANTTPLVSLSGTWNTTGAATGILLNVTDTSSAATSRLLDLQTSGATRFSITKAGAISFGATVLAIIQTGNGNTWLQGGYGQNTFINSDGLRMGLSSDIRIERDAANILAQRNGTNPQAFRLYNTFTDASNFERGFLRWNSNFLEIGTEAAGTGIGRVLSLQSGVQSGGLFGINIQGATTTATQGPALNFICSTNNAAPTNAQIYASRVDSNTSDLGLRGRIIHIGPNGFGYVGTNAFPALKRSSTTLQVRLADDSNFAPIQGRLTTETAYTVGSVTPTGWITLYDSTGTAYRVPCAV